jgi:alpha-glucosidase
MIRFYLLIFWALSVQIVSSQPIEHRLQSPDGQLEVVFTQKEISPGKRQMTYHVDYQKKPVILESGLGVQIDNHVFEHAMAHKVTTPPGTLGVNWCDNLVIKNVVRTSKDTTWKPIYGERSQIRDQYNQLEIQLQKPDSPDYGIHVIFRAYDSGIAFRYFFPEHPNGLYYRVTAENSEFTLPADTKAWYTA